MSETRDLIGMVILPKEKNVSLKCVDTVPFSFENEKGEAVEGIKLKFIPDDLSYGEVAFTIMANSDSLDLEHKITQGGFYRLGLDINSKGKVSIVDFIKTK